MGARLKRFSHKVDLMTWHMHLDFTRYIAAIATRRNISYSLVKAVVTDKRLSMHGVARAFNYNNHEDLLRDIMPIMLREVRVKFAEGVDGKYEYVPTNSDYRAFTMAREEGITSTKGMTYCPECWYWYRVEDFTYVGAMDNDDEEPYEHYNCNGCDGYNA